MEFHSRDGSEAIPGNVSESGENCMTTHCFVGANHAGDTETRWSQQTGTLLFFCNWALAIWFSKRQNSLEASTYISESTAMKNGIKMIEACATSCACLEFQLKHQQIYCVIMGRYARIWCGPRRHWPRSITVEFQWRTLVSILSQEGLTYCDRYWLGWLNANDVDPSKDYISIYS